jgi:Putative Flp pilus-assembly TadE/G-like
MCSFATPRPCRSSAAAAEGASRRVPPSRHGRVEGQALIMVALAFVLLVAFLGLAIDGANAFGQRRLIGNAVDAAAIAGARELIAQLDRGNGGTAVNDAIETFLSGEHNLQGAALSWQAFYVDRLNPDGSLGPVVDGARPPSGADGVRVEALITYPTYFMGVFGQRTMSVSGAGAAVFGPLGTAVGQDLVPVALSVTGLEILQDEGTVQLDLRGSIVDALALMPYDPMDPTANQLPDDVITAADIKHVSFAEVSVAPVTGDDCLAGTPQASLTYWWCQGSPNKLRINRELPWGDPNYATLNSAITWRRDNREVLVLPVYADSMRSVGGVDEIYYTLVNFVAVEIRGYNTSQGVLRLRHLPNYATAGAMVGDGSGVETGVWAVNLTR